MGRRRGVGTIVVLRSMSLVLHLALLLLALLSAVPIPTADAFVPPAMSGPIRHDRNRNHPTNAPSRRSYRSAAAGGGRGHPGGSSSDGNNRPPPNPPPRNPPDNHPRGEPHPDPANGSDNALVNSGLSMEEDEESSSGFVSLGNNNNNDTANDDNEIGWVDRGNLDDESRPLPTRVRGGAAASAASAKGSGGNPKRRRPRSRSRSRRGRNHRDGNNSVVRGTQATLASTAGYWSDAVQQFTQRVSRPFQQVSKRFFQSPQSKKQEELLNQLQTMPVQRIRVPNTTVLPQDVVQVAAKRCQMLGNALRMDRVQEFASVLSRWYARQGYVLHAVTGATLVPETATAEIAVVEPKVNAHPVGIMFVKEMVVVNNPEEENENGGAEGSAQTQLLTLRQYKDMYRKNPRLGRRSLITRGISSPDDIRKQDLNTTFVATGGRVKSHVIAAALGLRPGSHFRWDSGQWQRIVRSPLFAKILQATPAQLPDGTVQLQMIVQEAPLRHLEYGVGKSLYTDSWEGELEFEHLNVLGGGETLGVTVKRGTSEAAPSGKVTFGNAKFGNPGGYQVQLFRDFLGRTVKEAKSSAAAATATATATATANQDSAKEAPSATEAESGITVENPTPTAVVAPEEASTASEIPSVAEVVQPDPTGTSASTDGDVSGLFDRKGLSFRIRNPIPQRIMLNSAGSATVERTTSVSGLHENICSTTLSLGPFVRQLPYDARSNVDATLTTGTRVSIRHAGEIVDAPEQVAESATASSPASSSLLDRAQFLPYSTVTASTKQIFPLTQPPSRRLPQQQQQQRRPIVLALRHSVSTSSRHTPSYEAQALGNSVNIRGGEPNGNIRSCLRGTTEIRVPVAVPDFSKLLPKRGSAAAIATVPTGGGDGADTTAESTALSSPDAVSTVLATASNPIRQDANVVLFGDWLVAAQDSSTTPLFRKTSVGIGVRKSIQGIPLSLDLTYSKELKFRTSFGFGRDFDV
jgi:hypothetical protein